MSAQTLTVLDVARLAVRHWFLAFVCFVVFLAPFVYHAFTAIPVYRATVVLAASSAGSQAGSLGSALGQLAGLASTVGVPGVAGGRGAEVEESLVVLRSRSFNTALLVDMHADVILAQAMGLPAEATADGSAMAKIARYFDGSVRTVLKDKKTGLYQLSIDWTDPEVAAVWANETVAHLNAVMRTRAIERSRANQQYLREEAARADQVDVRNALSRLLESEIRQLMMANVTPDYAFRVVDAATAPQLDEKVRPQRRSIVTAGALFAVLASLIVVAGFGTLRARRVA